MLKFKPRIAALTLVLASCAPVYAIDKLGDDGKTFRLTDDEVTFCKANGGCTVVSNDEVARVAKAIAVLQQALEETQKKLKAEQSKRCI